MGGRSPGLSQAPRVRGVCAPWLPNDRATSTSLTPPSIPAAPVRAGSAACSWSTAHSPSGPPGALTRHAAERLPPNRETTTTRPNDGGAARCGRFGEFALPFGFLLLV